MDIAGRGTIKDVWVVGEDSEPHRSLWQDRGDPLNASAHFQGVFTSRSAENLYWVGRYAERVNRQVRVLRGMGRAELLLTGGMQKSKGELRKMLELMELFCGQDPPGKGNNMKRLKRSVSGGPTTGSLAQNLKSLVAAAYTVRDIWSQDSWRILVSLESLAEQFLEADPEAVTSSPLVGDLLEKLNAFLGLNISCMSRESGWSMLMLGRHLEGALGLCECIHMYLGPSSRREDPIAMMELLLQQNENLITYRRHYRTTPQMKSVLELVASSVQNPKSLTFYLEQIPERLHELPPPVEADALAPLLLEAKQLRSRLLEQKGIQVKEDRKLPLLDEIRDFLEETSDAVSSAYFSHTALRAREDF